ncbi:hypothetical protein AAEX37_01946 [Oligella sp. MSHR50489EDL]|uniref:hypothetical protein n=1 Tax=Oligella sp. MSHR50489EDL TaxID=3139409 RepID=UPI003D819B04
MKTLFLLPNIWDLCLDASGNIAVATDTYQQAQDIASACRVITKDMYFNQRGGIPYLVEILGKGSYPLALYRHHLERESLKIKGVQSVSVDLTLSEDRVVKGAINFTNDEGKKGVIGL